MPRAAPIYDFGQNVGGYVAFTVKGEAGARSSSSTPKSSTARQFDNRNMRSAEARLEYVLKGEGEESYRPYLHLPGLPLRPGDHRGRGARSPRSLSVPISSVHEPTGSFTSGNPLVNRLVENTIWSQRSNFIEVPTDCPQRDERLGWTGDAQVFAPTACYLHDSAELPAQVAARRDGRPARRTAPCRTSSPDPTRLHPKTVSRASSARPAGATRSASSRGRSTRTTAIAASSKKRCRRWCSGSISSGRSAMGRSSVRRAPGARAASPSATGCSRGRLQRKAAADHRRRRRGHDLPLHLVGADRQGRRVLGDAAIAERMDERAEAVKAAFQREFITALRPPRLRRPDLLRAGDPARPDPCRACCRRPRATSRRPSPAPTAASAPASSARRRCCRRCSRSASPNSPPRSSCRRRCPAGSTR